MARSAAGTTIKARPPTNDPAATPKYMADVMEEWFMQRGADGFTVLQPYYPQPLEDFVELVIPELQRRGLFRTEYTGRTLRENLGVPFPPNRFTLSRSA